MVISYHILDFYVGTKSGFENLMLQGYNRYFSLLLLSLITTHLRLHTIYIERKGDHTFCFFSSILTRLAKLHVLFVCSLVPKITQARRF